MFPNYIVVPIRKLCGETRRRARSHIIKPLGLLGLPLQPTTACRILGALKLDAVVASRCHLRKKEEQESLQDDDCFRAVLFVPLVALGLFLFECSPEKQGGGA